jgi:hypothetical protein
MRNQRHRAGRRERVLAVLVLQEAPQPTAPVALQGYERNGELYLGEGLTPEYTYWAEQTTAECVLMSCLIPSDESRTVVGVHSSYMILMLLIT